MPDINLTMQQELDRYSIEIFNTNFKTIQETINSINNILSDTPTIEEMPKKLSDLLNDINLVDLKQLGELLQHKVDLGEYEQLKGLVDQINKIVLTLDKVAITGNYNDLKNKPNLGKYISYDIVDEEE